MGDHERRLLKPHENPYQELKSYARALDKSVDACLARIDHLVGQHPYTPEDNEQWNLVSRVKHSAEIEAERTRLRYFRRRRTVLKVITAWFISLEFALLPLFWLRQKLRGTPKQGS